MSDMPLTTLLELFSLNLLTASHLFCRIASIPYKSFFKAKQYTTSRILMQRFQRGIDTLWIQQSMSLDIHGHQMPLVLLTRNLQTLSIHFSSTQPGFCFPRLCSSISRFVMTEYGCLLAIPLMTFFSFKKLILNPMWTLKMLKYQTRLSSALNSSEKAMSVLLSILKEVKKALILTTKVMLNFFAASTKLNSAYFPSKVKIAMQMYGDQVSDLQKYMHFMSLRSLLVIAIGFSVCFSRG